MRTALTQLLSDFVSVIAFVTVYGTTDNLWLATGAAIAVSVAQFIFFKLRGQAVDAMQWLILGMVVVLGAAALITADSRFVMVKPSIVHFAVGAVMLRRGWMMRYLPLAVRDNVPEPVLVISGYAWAALMFALGALNIVVALTLPFSVWAWFISFGAVGAKIVAFVVQYIVFRAAFRRKQGDAAAGAAARTPPQLHGDAAIPQARADTAAPPR
jgi:intracellular septation protein A